MKNLLAITCATLLLLAACSKSGNDAPTKTRTEILASGKWTLSAATAKVTSGSNVQEYDLMTGILKTCEKDNILIFHTDLTSAVDEGATKCDSAAPQTAPGTWQFLNAETRLRVVNAAGTNALVADILEINGLQMKLKYDTSYVTLPTAVTTTWTHVQ